MPRKLKFFAFSGSLRKGSFNTALLNTAKELAPKNIEIEIFKLDGIPIFNQDFEKDMPKIVKQFKSKIKAADAILIATPEYNFSFSGVLKNAIDWASRPYGDNSFDDKPVAVMSAGGLLGGIKAQMHLRQVFAYLDMHALNHPMVVVTNAHEKIDKNGKVTDPETRKRINEQLVALAQWTQRIKK